MQYVFHNKVFRYSDIISKLRILLIEKGYVDHTLHHEYFKLLIIIRNFSRSRQNIKFKINTSGIEE